MAQDTIARWNEGGSCSRAESKNGESDSVPPSQKDNPWPIFQPPPAQFSCTPAMPTALSFYQFSAAICIDGRPLDIWNPTFDQETGVAEAWIASEAGKEYSIHWKRDFDIGCDVSGKVQLDGSTQTSASIVPPRRFFGWNELRGARASAYSEKPFAFAEIRTTGQ